VNSFPARVVRDTIREKQAELAGALRNNDA
jgi:hypothetical protein